MDQLMPLVYGELWRIARRHMAGQRLAGVEMARRDLPVMLYLAGFPNQVGSAMKQRALGAEVPGRAATHGRPAINTEAA